MTTTTLHASGLRRWRLGGRWRHRSRASDPIFVRLFARFALTGLIAVGALTAVAFVVIRDSATSGAIRQAMGLSEWPAGESPSR
jgi:hypothetical protein